MAPLARALTRTGAACPSTTACGIVLQGGRPQVGVRHVARVPVRHEVDVGLQLEGEHLRHGQAGQPARENPTRENPVREKPAREKPARERPAKENPTREK